MTVVTVVTLIVSDTEGVIGEEDQQWGFFQPTVPSQQIVL